MEEGVINQCSFVYYLELNDSIQKFASELWSTFTCGKNSSVNDDPHSLRILASLLSLKNIALNLTISGALQYKIWCFSSQTSLLMHFFYI